MINESKLIFKAKVLNGEKIVEGFFTKKKVGNLMVPVIERIVESDNGDYIESTEIDGNTLESII